MREKGRAIPGGESERWARDDSEGAGVGDVVVFPATDAVQSSENRVPWRSPLSCCSTSLPAQRTLGSLAKSSLEGTAGMTKSSSRTPSGEEEEAIVYVNVRRG